MTNQEYANKKNHYVVVSNGNQAPYGIGEIISSHKSLSAAEKKAKKWHTMPQIIFPEN